MANLRSLVDGLSGAAPDTSRLRALSRGADDAPVPTVRQPLGASPNVRGELPGAQQIAHARELMNTPGGRQILQETFASMSPRQQENFIAAVTAATRDPHSPRSSMLPSPEGQAILNTAAPDIFPPPREFDPDVFEAARTPDAVGDEYVPLPRGEEGYPPGKQPRTVVESTRDADLNRPDPKQTDRGALEGDVLIDEEGNVVQKGATDVRNLPEDVAAADKAKRGEKPAPVSNKSADKGRRSPQRGYDQRLRRVTEFAPSADLSLGSPPPRGTSVADINAGDMGDIDALAHELGIQGPVQAAFESPEDFARALVSRGSPEIFDVTPITPNQRMDIADAVRFVEDPQSYDMVARALFPDETRAASVASRAVGQEQAVQALARKIGELYGPSWGDSFVPSARPATDAPAVTSQRPLEPVDMPVSRFPDSGELDANGNPIFSEDPNAMPLPGGEMEPPGPMSRRQAAADLLAADPDALPIEAPASAVSPSNLRPRWNSGVLEIVDADGNLAAKLDGADWTDANGNPLSDADFDAIQQAIDLEGGSAFDLPGADVDQHGVPVDTSPSPYDLDGTPARSLDETVPMDDGLPDGPEIVDPDAPAPVDVRPKRGKKKGKKGKAKPEESPAADADVDAAAADAADTTTPPGDSPPDKPKAPGDSPESPAPKPDDATVPKPDDATAPKPDDPRSWRQWAYDNRWRLAAGGLAVGVGLPFLRDKMKPRLPGDGGGAANGSEPPPPPQFFPGADDVDREIAAAAAAAANAVDTQRIRELGGSPQKYKFNPNTQTTNNFYY